MTKQKEIKTKVEHEAEDWQTVCWAEPFKILFNILVAKSDNVKILRLEH